MGALILVLGYWLAFNQPTELQKQVSDGEVYVYWVKTTPTDFEVVPQRRVLSAGLDNEVALKLTMEMLMVGPTDNEKLTGLTTAIPKDAVVRSVKITGNKATVDFNEKIDTGVAGSATVLAIREQLDSTIRRFPGIDEVELTVNGERPVQLEP